MSGRVDLFSGIPGLLDDLDKALDRVVQSNADEYKDRLIIELHSIKHGREYPSRAIKGNIHIASKPGESPGADTGDLEDSISIIRELLVAAVGSNHPAALRLEIGDSKVAARPMWIPVAESLKDQVIEDAQHAVLDVATTHSVK